MTIIVDPWVVRLVLVLVVLCLFLGVAAFVALVIMARRAEKRDEEYRYSKNRGNSGGIV